MSVNDRIDSLIRGATTTLDRLQATITLARSSLPALVAGTYTFDNEPRSFWRILRGTPGMPSDIPGLPTPRPFVRADTVSGGIVFELNFGRPVRVMEACCWHRARQNQPMEHYIRCYDADDGELATLAHYRGGSDVYGWFCSGSIRCDVQNVRRVQFVYTQHTDADMTGEVTIEVPRLLGGPV